MQLEGRNYSHREKKQGKFFFSTFQYKLNLNHNELSELSKMIRTLREDCEIAGRAFVVVWHLFAERTLLGSPLEGTVDVLFDLEHVLHPLLGAHSDVGALRLGPPAPDRLV